MPGHLLQFLQLIVHDGERVRAGCGLYAANSCSDAPFCVDLEHADIAGARYVRAAAQFA